MNQFMARVVWSLLIASAGATTSLVSRPLLAPFGARIVHVDDGDTVTVVRDGEPVRIRLEGVDCPERGQPFSDDARAFTAHLLLHRDAQIRPVTVDAYDRIVARVRVDGTDVSEALVGAGLAWHYTHYSYDRALATAERAARAARRGLWSAPAPVAPWTWRETARADARAQQAPEDRSADTPERQRPDAGDRAAPPARPRPRGEGAQSSPSQTVPRQGVAYHGNVYSRVFHAPGCPYYDCRNCSRLFTSVDQARAAGYRPHAECVR